MDKKHCGSTLDSLFEEMGALQEMNERLSKRIFVEQLREAMKRRRISLSEFARRMNTSRTAARRLLDHTVPGVTLGSLVSASTAVGMAFEPRLMEARKQATYVKKYGATARSGHDDTTAAGERKYARRRG
jgi:antitoxin HicB